MRMKALFIEPVFVVAIVLATGGCGARSHARALRVPVTVATAAEQAMPFALTSTGTIEPIQTTAVGSQVGGLITRIAFREGEDVREGQPLFQLDPRPFRAALGEAVAALARDAAQAEQARLNAVRSRALFEQGAIAAADWDQARAAAEAAIATLRADSAAVRAARFDLDAALVRAPITGRTGSLFVHEGDYVKAATNAPLVTINQRDPVRVRFTVPLTAVPLVQRYRNARPRVFVWDSDADSSTSEGSLVFVDNAVDEASGTLLLKGEFPNRDGRLVPGEFVEVRLVLYVEPRAVVVPARSVTDGQRGTFVYVLNPDSTVASRNVVVARTVNDLVVVETGLKPGETVITDGQLRLAPGTQVTVRAGAGVAS